MLANKNPLVTLALFTFNHEKYIEDAVNGVLNQSYKNLEIIISDDCSTDSTFEIIKSLVSNYGGTHKISVNRNPKNLGLVSHFNNIIKSSRGEIVVVAAGDDISLPDRVSRTVDIFNSDPKATIVSFTDIIIDTNGNEFLTPAIQNDNVLKMAMLHDYIKDRAPFVSGASRGYKKTIFTTFGNLNSKCPTEDTPCLLRGLMTGHAIVSLWPGIKYRQHETNLSRPQSVHSMNIDEIRDQYICDARVAFNSGLISKNDLQSTAAWIERTYQRRTLIAGFYNANNKINFFNSKVIASKHFSLREKGRLLMDLFFGSKN